jgi:hypothetical protein
MSRVDKEELSRSGMALHAPGIGWIVHCLVERFVKDGGAGLSYFDGVEHESTQPLHDLVKVMMIETGVAGMKLGK